MLRSHDRISARRLTVTMIVLIDLATGIFAVEGLHDRGMAEEARRFPLETPSTATSPYMPSLPPSQIIAGQDRASMVLIPAGEYMMGSLDGNADEAPRHAVYLDAFYLDRYEVTTAQYAMFLRKTHRAEPARWSEVHMVRDRDRPVIGVDWHDANAYCRYYHKRLPTEAEWEKAARGTDGRIYPWGNDDPTDQHANFNKCCSWDGYEILAEVGSLEAGKSPYGIYNMGGNVREWVEDWYDAHYYRDSPSRNPPGPPQGYWKVLRGGSWHSDADNLRATLRYRQAPEVRFNHIGFRCALGVG